MKRGWTVLLLLALALALLAAGALWQLNFNDGVDIRQPATGAAEPATIERGAYLAQVGNCLACHTARGGAPGAGGRALPTGFGTVYSSNLTPDVETGIGGWSPNAFWRALHHGRSADGRLLVPAFPYTHTTLLTRGDVDALYAYFRSLPPTQAIIPPHELRWPFGTQLALAAWRALYFRPGELAPEPARDASWNRGRYLVHAVAHCSACHAHRNRLGGGDWLDLNGNVLAGQAWYAPSLHDPGEAALAGWPAAEVERLLRSGVAEAGRASGPMAEVVLRGTQYLDDADLAAMTDYLQALPPTRAETPASTAVPGRARLLEIGARRYAEHCASCHGEQGEGVAGAYPPLAGNRAVTMGPIDNVLQAVLFGGFNAATPGHPRPFGMPPFLLTFSDTDIAAVLTHIRAAWGNQGSAVTPLQVHQLRAATLQGTTN